MIVERFQRVGSFSLALDPAAPAALRSTIAEYGHIFITPTEMSADAFSDATIQAQALWSGVVTGPPAAGQIDGWGLGWWLGGNGDHDGDAIETPVTLATVTLSSALSTLLPAGQPIIPGTVTNTGTSITTVLPISSRFQGVAEAIALAGAEWIIQPDFTIDAAATGTLFSTTPTVLLTTDPEPLDMAGVRGVEIAKATSSIDARGYATKIIAVAQSGDGSQVATGSATRSTSYLDGLGNSVALQRFVNLPAVPDANADTVAQNLLNLSSVRKSIAATARPDHLRRILKPGDYVYLYDQAGGLLDRANQITYQGDVICPVITRLYGITWGFEQGMGCFYRSASGTITDLTPYIVRETGDTQLDVGRSAAGPDDDLAAYSTSSALTDIAARAMLGKRVSYTPTWSGTLGNGTLTGSYQIVGDWCRGVIALTWGSTSSHGASIQTFGLPAGLTNAATEGTPMGFARLIDTGVANYGRAAFKAGSTIVLMAENGTFVTNTVPFTPGNTDQTLIEFAFPI